MRPFFLLAWFTGPLEYLMRLASENSKAMLFELWALGQHWANSDDAFLLID